MMQTTDALPHSKIWH